MTLQDAPVPHPDLAGHWIVRGIYVVPAASPEAAAAMVADGPTGAEIEPPPYRPTGDDVRLEASRRLQRLVGARDATHLEIIIANGTREAVRLLRLKAARDWTPAEAARAAVLERLDAAIEAIRDASNTMEADPPEDYASDARWP